MTFVFQMVWEAVNRITTDHNDLLATTWRTLWLAFGATGVAALLGLPLGVAIGQARPRVRGPLTAIANAGLGLPAVVLGVIVGLLLVPVGGPLGSWRWLDTIQAVFSVQVLFALPIVVALTASAVSRQAESVLLQARAFGAGPVARGLLALREARIGVVAALIAALGSTIGEVAAVTIVGGNLRGATNTLASSVLLDVAQGDIGAATADVMILLVIVGILGLALTLVQQRGRRSGVAA